jgi:hypothetical protein
MIEHHSGIIMISDVLRVMKDRNSREREKSVRHRIMTDTSLI